MTMTELLQYISNNGFAICVAAYMIIVQSKQLTAMTEALTKLTTVIESLEDKVGGTK